MAEPAIRHVTLAEFLRWEDGIDTRYELLWGVPVAMAPPARPHGVLCVRLGAAIDGAVRSRRPCMAKAEAGIVRADRDATYYVADLAVTCNPYRRGEQFFNDPILIVEILSSSTERHDRQVKVPAYRDIDSVNEILLADSESIYAEILRREGNHWMTELVRGRDAILHLPSVDLRIAMAELYEGIDIDVENAA
jgi:Uma2 family endonuclease